MSAVLFGPRSRQLASDSLLPLKAIYTFAEQLYCDAIFTIKTVQYKEKIPTALKGVLELFSIMPKQIEELKNSAFRQGAIAGLSRALAFVPELTPAEMIDGYLSKKDDESQFTEADYIQCVKDSRFLASVLADEADLNVYQAAYDGEDKRIRGPLYEWKSLTPARSKELFSNDLNTSPFF